MAAITLKERAAEAAKDWDRGSVYADEDNDEFKKWMFSEEGSYLVTNAIHVIKEK